MVSGVTQWLAVRLKEFILLPAFAVVVVGISSIYPFVIFVPSW